MPAEVTITREGSITRARIQGDIDVATAPELRNRIRALLADGHVDLLVDLAGVEFIDSVGLSALIGGLKRAREAGGDLRIVAARPAVLRVFEITGLLAVFAVPGDTASRRASASRAPSG